MPPTISDTVGRWGSLLVSAAFEAPPELEPQAVTAAARAAALSAIVSLRLNMVAPPSWVVSDCWVGCGARAPAVNSVRARAGSWGLDPAGFDGGWRAPRQQAPLQPADDAF